jgi:hypothetical protein
MSLVCVSGGAFGVFLEGVELRAPQHLDLAQPVLHRLERVPVDAVDTHPRVIFDSFIRHQTGLAQYAQMPAHAIRSAAHRDGGLRTR